MVNLVMIFLSPLLLHAFLIYDGSGPYRKCQTRMPGQITQQLSTTRTSPARKCIPITWIGVYTFGAYGPLSLTL